MAFIGEFLRSFCKLYAGFSYDYSLISLAIAFVITLVIFILTMVALPSPSDYVSADALPLLAPRGSGYLAKMAVGSLTSLDLAAGSSPLNIIATEFTLTLDFGTYRALDRRFFALVNDVVDALKGFETAGDCAADLRPAKLRDALWRLARFDLQSSPAGTPVYRLGDALMTFSTPDGLNGPAVQSPLCIFDNSVDTLNNTDDAQIPSIIHAASTPGAHANLCAQVTSASGPWVLTDYLADPQYGANGVIESVRGFVVKPRVRASPSCATALEQLKESFNTQGAAFTSPYYVQFDQFNADPSAPQPTLSDVPKSTAATSAFATALMSAVKSGALFGTNSTLAALKVGIRGDDSLFAMLAEHTLVPMKPGLGFIPLAVITIIFMHTNVPCLFSRNSNGGQLGIRLLFTRTRILLSLATLALEALTAGAAVALTRTVRPLFGYNAAWGGAMVGAAFVCQAALAICAGVPAAGASFGATGKDEAAAAGRFAYDYTKGSKKVRRAARLAAIERALGDGFGMSADAAAAAGSAEARAVAAGQSNYEAESMTMTMSMVDGTGSTDGSVTGGSMSGSTVSSITGHVGDVDTRRHPRVLLDTTTTAALMPTVVACGVAAICGFVLSYFASTYETIIMCLTAGFGAITGLILVLFVFIPLFALNLRRVASSRLEFCWLFPLDPLVRARADSAATVMQYRYSIGRLCKKFGELVSFPPFAWCMGLLALALAISGGVLFADNVGTSTGVLIADSKQQAGAWRDAQDYEAKYVTPHTGVPTRVVNIMSLPTLNVLPEMFGILNVVFTSLIGHLSLMNEYDPLPEIGSTWIRENIPSLYVEQDMVDAQRNLLLGAGAGVGAPVKALPGTTAEMLYSSPFDAFKRYISENTDPNLTSTSSPLDTTATITPPRPEALLSTGALPWPAYNSTFSTIVDKWDQFTGSDAYQLYQDDKVSGARLLTGLTLGIESLCSTIGDFFGANLDTFGFQSPINDFVDACRVAAPTLDRMLMGTPVFNAIPFRAGSKHADFIVRLSAQALAGRRFHPNIEYMLKGVTELVEEVGTKAAKDIAAYLNRGIVDGAGGDLAGRKVFSEETIKAMAATFEGEEPPKSITTFAWSDVGTSLLSEIDHIIPRDTILLLVVASLTMWIVGMLTVELVAATVATIGFIGTILTGSACLAITGAKLTFPRAVGCMLGVISVSGMITHMVSVIADQNPRLAPRYRIASAMVRNGPTMIGAILASALAPVGAAVHPTFAVVSAFSAYGLVHLAAAIFIYLILPAILSLAMPYSFNGAEFMRDLRADAKEALAHHKTTLRVHLGPEVEALADAIHAREHISAKDAKLLRAAANDLGIDAGSIDTILDGSVGGGTGTDTEGSTANSMLNEGSVSGVNSGIRMPKRGASSGFTLQMGYQSATMRNLHTDSTGSFDTNTTPALAPAPAPAPGGAAKPVDGTADLSDLTRPNTPADHTHNNLVSGATITPTGACLEDLVSAAPLPRPPQRRHSNAFMPSSDLEDDLEL